MDPFLFLFMVLEDLANSETGKNGRLSEAFLASRRALFRTLKLINVQDVRDLRVDQQ